MFKHLETFLKANLEPGKPVLFGYSGGVDSSCLFYLLKICKQKLNLDLHVIHINHGWRESSFKEALALKEEVDLLKIPFYLETINTVDPHKEKNLEEKYRNERIRIFRRIYDLLGAQALLLAHQKEDLGETIFKRIFEGASLGKVVGLKECATLEGMKILRPLLPFSKKELYELAKKENIIFIEDETNIDPKYLRARQRVSIFPQIEKSFGKSSLNNLCKLGRSLHRYESYIEKNLQKYQKCLVKGPLGIYINLGLLDPLEPLELECFIRKMCETYGENISFEALEMLVEKVLQKSSNKQLKLKDLEIIVDREHLFFVTPIINEPAFREEVSIEMLPYSIECGGFMWTILSIDSELAHESVSWKDLWRGHYDFTGLNEPFTFMPVDLSYKIGAKSLKDLYIENKVPAFLRKRVPNIFQQGSLRCNPLIRLSSKGKKGKEKFRLSIENVDKKKNFY